MARLKRNEEEQPRENREDDDRDSDAVRTSSGGKGLSVESDLGVLPVR